jgi:hypothetical protein
MAVQYVKFPLSATAEAALREGSKALRLGVDHPAYRAEVPLGAETILSLRDDLD